MNETLLVSRIVETLLPKQPRMMNVSMTHLIHDMISLLYTVHRSDTTHRKLSWSLSAGDLPNFVYNFVRTQDCFLQTLDGPCLLLDLSHSYTDCVLTVFANIHWQLPRTTFSGDRKSVV